MNVCIKYVQKIILFSITPRKLLQFSSPRVHQGLKLQFYDFTYYGGRS